MTEGFNRLELLVVICTVGILGLLGWRALRPAQLRPERSKITCQNNLKQLGLTIETWANDAGGKPPWLVPLTNEGTTHLRSDGNPTPYLQVLSNGLATPRILVCEADSRQPAQDFASLKTENISYFLSMDADLKLPSAILAGDRNLIINSKPATPGLNSVTTNSTVTWSKKLHTRVELYPSGVFLFADGHVVFETNTLPSIKNQGIATNHIAVP